MALSIKQDLDSLIASPSHQKVSTSLLSIRGQIERKPQLQKANQIDQLDHSLV